VDLTPVLGGTGPGCELERLAEKEPVFAVLLDQSTAFEPSE
jgi:hypothetical protein